MFCLLFRLPPCPTAQPCFVLFRSIRLQVEARLDSIDQKVTELLMRMDHEEKLREEEARRRARVALQQPQ